MIQVAVPQRDIAVAMANFSFDSYIGGCIGVTVSGSIFNRALVKALSQGYSEIDATSQGISAVFLWCVPPIVVAAMLGFFLHPVKQKKPKLPPGATNKEIQMTSSTLALQNNNTNISSTASSLDTRPSEHHVKVSDSR